MSRFLIASFLFVSLSLSLAAAASRGADTDIAEIEQVMAEYHAAVAAHDGGKLASLFLPEGGTWLNVLAGQIPKVKAGNFRDFAKFVSETGKALDATHSNVGIQTDGTIASVTFDFVFLIDGKATNRGAEAWQLVKGADGGRIAALTYSSHPADPP